ncbi:MAG: zf-TFIIB domain-containing protein [Deltaproteobacteria bacterium]|nr:zf-TFIIB domain-containing protein [Deltaproteobacteria bacterium]
MENEKDRFGEKMRLVERAKEDIYFAAKDRELIERLKSVLKKVEGKPGEERFVCPKCRGNLQTYSFMEFVLDRCQSCEGMWLDKGELEGILRKASRGLLDSVVDWIVGKEEANAGGAKR